MECNKDEALRSRNIAEQKFMMHDLKGAKKFALKAHHLFPDLEGLPQLLAVLDVHITAEEIVVGGDRNWYGILQTDATADDATIKKQYRKLALILHPDKNNAVGAEGAFKLISEAWSVLSDKGKKAAHDARRGEAGRFANSFCNFSNFRASSWAPSKPAEKSGMFWSTCSSCKDRFRCSRPCEINILCAVCEQQHPPQKDRRARDDSWCSPTDDGKAKASCYETSPCKADDHHIGDSSASPEARHHNKRSNTRCDESANVNMPGDEPQCHAGRQAYSGATSWHYQQLPSAFSSSKGLKRTNIHVHSNFQFHWGSHKNRMGSINVAATVKATADMVQNVYETVRRERVRAQNEARRKAMEERLEKERETCRQEHKGRREQKQKRKEEELKKQAHAAVHAKMAFNRLFAREHKFSTEDTRKADEVKTDANEAIIEDVSGHEDEFGKTSHADLVV